MKRRPCSVRCSFCLAGARLATCQACVVYPASKGGLCVTVRPGGLMHCNLLPGSFPSASQICLSPSSPRSPSASVGSPCIRTAPGLAHPSAAYSLHLPILSQSCLSHSSPCSPGCSWAPLALALRLDWLIHLQHACPTSLFCCQLLLRSSPRSPAASRILSHARFTWTGSSNFSVLVPPLCFVANFCCT